jgi:hypothetical protein
MLTGRSAPEDPENWMIVDGKLYLGRAKQKIE